MKKDKKIFDLKRFLIPILRRKSLFYPERARAINLSKIERGFYRCKACEGAFSRKQIHVDHKQSVISVKDAWIDWNTYIERLFVPAEQMQVLCINCHSAKTQIENQIRSVNKKKDKKKKKT